MSVRTATAFLFFFSSSAFAVPTESCLPSISSHLLEDFSSFVQRQKGDYLDMVNQGISDLNADRKRLVELKALGTSSTFPSAKDIAAQEERVSNDQRYLAEWQIALAEFKKCIDSQRNQILQSVNAPLPPVAGEDLGVIFKETPVPGTQNLLSTAEDPKTAEDFAHLMKLRAKYIQLSCSRLAENLPYKDSDAMEQIALQRSELAKDNRLLQSLVYMYNSLAPKADAQGKCPWQPAQESNSKNPKPERAADAAPATTAG